MERLNELVKQKGPLLAGLDPDMEKVLELPKETGNCGMAACDFMQEFCYKYIDAVKDQVQKTLEEMAADGTAAKISEKWFGKDITTIQ